MQYAFVYTRILEESDDRGIPERTPERTPERIPGDREPDCEPEDAVYLALSEDGKCFTPVKNNKGILSAKVGDTQGVPGGGGKVLRDPWLFRYPDGTYGICCVRRVQNAPDPDSRGCVLFYASDNLAQFKELGYVHVAEGEISRPRCQWDKQTGCCCLEWEYADLSLGGAVFSKEALFPESASEGSADAGMVDARTVETGKADAGMADAGTADAGTADAGTADAGTAETGKADAGTADAGMADAGTREGESGRSTGVVRICADVSQEAEPLDRLTIFGFIPEISCSQDGPLGAIRPGNAIFMGDGGVARLMAALTED